MENLFKQFFYLARAKFGESRLQRGLPTESRVSGSEEMPRVRSVIPNVVASGNDAGEPFGAFALGRGKAVAASLVGRLRYDLVNQLFSDHSGQEGRGPR